jgi:hypothetical protein
MDELARLALLIPALPEKLVLVSPEIVFEPAAIVLLVNVSLVVLPTMVSVASGRVRVLLVLGVQLKVPIWVEPSVS